VSADMPEIPDLDTTATNENVPPYAFMAVVEGIAVQRFNVDAGTAAVFASNPTFVQIPNTVIVPKGSTYDGDGFTPPAPE
jgi:hypothetical protein